MDFIENVDDLQVAVETIEESSQDQEIMDTQYEQLIAEVKVTNDLLAHQYALGLFTTGCLTAVFVVYLLFRFMKLFY